MHGHMNVKFVQIYIDL